MTPELDIALRFLRRRSGPLLRGTALAAFASVALATAALVVTISLMTGYRGAIAAALQHGNAHLVGFGARPMEEAEAERLAEQMAAVPGVRRAAAVTYLAGLIHDPAEPASPLPIVIKAVSTPPSFTGLENWPATDELSAVIGERLAAALRLTPGSLATVQLPPHGGAWVVPSLGLRVAGTFRLSFSEFDERWIVVHLRRLLAAVPGLGVAGIEVELDDPLAVNNLRPRLEEVASELVLTDWTEMNSALFAALRWQTISLFVVLSLVVAVASFQVSSSMVVLAIDKRRSAGMLQALGATPARVRKVLILAGTILGEAGVLSGMAAGCAASWLMTTFRLIRFPAGLARVYMVDHIPLMVEPAGLLAVVGVCSLLVIAASVWPAWRTARQDPVTALKSV